LAVSVQQAAANAAVAYFKTRLPRDIAVHARWPGKDFPGKAITLITAGSRRDQPLDPRILSKSNRGDNQTRAIWQIAECTQPFQLDLWATSHIERDDLIARLDEILRAGFAPLTDVVFKDPVANGFFVKLADGWEEAETTAKFSFTSPDIDDSADAFARNQFRATYRGTAWMKLTIIATSPRQRAINLTALLDGSDQPRTNTVID